MLQECDKILLLMMELELLVRNLPAENIAPPETQNSLLAYVREGRNHSLLTYMTHVVRSTLNKDRLDSILEHLQMDETRVIMDWKMKLLMTVFRESMFDYFGKRGIPWMGTMLVRLKMEAEINPEKADQRKPTGKPSGTGDTGSGVGDSGGTESTSDNKCFVRQYSVNFYDGLCDDIKEDSWASASHLQGALLH